MQRVSWDRLASFCPPVWCGALVAGSCALPTHSGAKPRKTCRLASGNHPAHLLEILGLLGQSELRFANQYGTRIFTESVMLLTERCDTYTVAVRRRPAKRYNRGPGGCSADTDECVSHGMADALNKCIHAV